MKTRNLYRSQSMHAHPQISQPLGQNWPEMSGSMIEMLGATPRIGRRSMALADIDPKYVSQSGIWEASEVETSRGSIRIQHLTAASVSAGVRSLSGSLGSGLGAVGGALRPQFEKLEECAHFHYDTVELTALKIYVQDDGKGITTIAEEDSASCNRSDKCGFSLEVVSNGQSWIIRRTHANLHLLDEQLHRCVWKRSFTQLDKVHREQGCTTSDEHVECLEFVERYFTRLNQLPTDIITCGTVLGWLELDQRGHHIVSTDDSAINTPAVAAACALRKYVGQAPDELSFEVGDMISVIDMPPPEESIWWRGKQGFKVGFFPRDCVQVIGDKVPSSLPIVPSNRRRLSGTNSSPMPSVPEKPVLKKHPKLIAFFRSFILNRPSRRQLKKSGILRDRVFSCDLAEHLLTTGNDVPSVLKCCAEYIERYGIVDGIYRLSGITSNIQKLRNAFDEDKVPNLEEDDAIKQDIHAVSSLLKMYFRELPNPLCTYQLYEKFVVVAQTSDAERLFKMREVVQELPPPHYRTLEYLMKHLARVASRSQDTGMTPKNMAIVWAPNLIRCKELESGGVEALKGIGVQAVVTEYLVRHADLIFTEKLPANLPQTTTLVTHRSASACSSIGRPKSLAISSPIRLMSLEEAQDKAKDDRKYIEVNGGPASLPLKYHTIIEHPSRRGVKNKRSPIRWKHFFRRGSVKGKSDPGNEGKRPLIGHPTLIATKHMVNPLRPVKSVESLVSPPSSFTTALYPQGVVKVDSSNSMERMLDRMESSQTAKSSKSQLKSSPTTPIAEVQVVQHPPPQEYPLDSSSPESPRAGRSSLRNEMKGHNRSLSHDSYFEFGEFRTQNKAFIDDIVEEESMSQESSKLSLYNANSSGLESIETSPRKRCSSGGFSADAESNASKSYATDGSFRSPVTPPPSAASVHDSLMCSFVSQISTSSEDVLENSDMNVSILPKSPVLRPRKSKKCRETGLTHKDKVPALHGQERANPSDDTVKGLPFRNLQTAAFTLEEEEPEPSEFSFKPLIPSGTFSSGKHELDKNSSVDESSNDSTPGEKYPVLTNIIYSPLINEVTSPTSTNHSSSCENLSSRKNSFLMQAGNLFVCPLYEAGVQSQNFGDSTGWETNQFQSTSSGFTILEKSVTPVPAARSERTKDKPKALYENVVVSAETDHAVFVESNFQQEEVVKATNLGTGELSSHVYANEREYENCDVVQEIKAFNSELVPELGNQESPEVVYGEGADSEDLYYENVEDEAYNKSIAYESSNIYEDIDDEQCQAIDSCPKSNYEPVGSNQEQSPPLPALNVVAAVDPEDNAECPYESVQYTRYDQDQVLAQHHYAEITDATETQQLDGSRVPIPFSEESSESQSHTEDILTYLEAKSQEMRSDSLEEQDHIQEDVLLANCSSAITPDSNATTPSKTFKFSVVEDEEIRHIDSPTLVDNPLYSLESVEDDNANVSSALESRPEQNSVELRNPASSERSPVNKVLGRCNSAPLPLKLVEGSVSIAEFGEEEAFEKTDYDDDLKDISTRSDSVLEGNSFRSRVASHEPCSDESNSSHGLSKRMSEPSLHQASCPLPPPRNKLDPNFTAWKIADAKRLANRKQSVRELLSKFESTATESQSSGSSVSLTSNSSQPKSGNNRNSATNRSSSQSKPALPRPDSKPTVSGHSVSNNAFVKLNNNNNNYTRSRPGGGSGKFQHHRFSMGDILMTHSTPSAEDATDLELNISSMIRSDTFPELRTEASKENADEDGINASCRSLEGNGPPLVAEKVQHAIRVAMSSVDMNDPNTRERIEKYKEERRSFLRQKINSGISTERSPSSESKEMVAIVTNADRDSVSSNDSVFTCATVKVFSGAELNLPAFSCGKSSESPRKRAFSEDVVPVQNNQFKSIKTDACSFENHATEPEPCSIDSENGNSCSNLDLVSSTKAGETPEEVNVREKVALWADRKRAVSDQTVGLTADIAIFSSNEPSGPPVPVRSSLKPAISLPPEGFSKLPVIKREVPLSNLEAAKLMTTKVRSLSTRSDGGKKIKDMAAFFENKQF